MAITPQILPQRQDNTLQLLQFATGQKRYKEQQELAKQQYDKAQAEAKQRYDDANTAATSKAALETKKNQFKFLKSEIATTYNDPQAFQKLVQLGIETGETPEGQTEDFYRKAYAPTEEDYRINQLGSIKSQAQVESERSALVGEELEKGRLEVSEGQLTVSQRNATVAELTYGLNLAEFRYKQAQDKLELDAAAKKKGLSPSLTLDMKSTYKFFDDLRLEDPATIEQVLSDPATIKRMEDYNAAAIAEGQPPIQITNVEKTPTGLMKILNPFLKAFGIEPSIKVATITPPTVENSDTANVTETPLTLSADSIRVLTGRVRETGDKAALDQLKRGGFDTTELEKEIAITPKQQQELDKNKFLTSFPSVSNYLPTNIFGGGR
jgi:hypothetical protein